MNVQLLIDSLVRQMTVLIAQLATSGGARAPLAHVANQVFVDLATELERQGLSRKLTADMFGISLRAYQRKVQRLRESRTERGRSVWEAVLGYLGARSVVARSDVIQHFHRDPEPLVASILHDLVDSGLVFCSGQGADAVYRVVSVEELSTLRESGKDRGLSEFVWAHVYRHGPLTRDRLVDMVGVDAALLDSVLEELRHAGRIEREAPPAEPVYRAASLVIGLDAQQGFEASMYDHFQALVSTLCRKLDPELSQSGYGPFVGGSTYSFDVGPEHPLRDEVLATLRQFRERCSELRARVNDFNAQPGAAPPCERVVAYAGQSVFRDESESVEGELP